MRLSSTQFLHSKYELSQIKKHMLYMSFQVWLILLSIMISSCIYFIASVRDEKGDVTTDTKEIPIIIRKCYKQLNANKSETLEEMNRFMYA